jgi:pro-sigmaK processing inhibitor BofA
MAKQKEAKEVQVLIINAILGIILLFLTNLFLADDIPINIVTVVICAVFGVLGWAVILILHLLGGLAF